MNENQTTILGKVVITPKGNYSDNVQYAVLDLVGLYGSSYLALKASRNIPVTNTEYWMLIAEKGESVTDVQWTEDKHLIIILSNGTQVDIEEFAEALTDMGSATSAATSAASSANSAATAANNAASDANNAAEAANTSADSAARATTFATGAASAASAAAATANTAANNANAKASLANEKAELANEKASLANTKAEAAQTAATNANNAAASATTAEGNANTAAASANSAATAATTAAGSANTAATTANTAASNAEAKATIAQEAATAADEAREGIQDDLATKVDKSAQAEKTSDMTQPVGIDENGKLWAEGGGTAGKVTYDPTETYASGTVGEALNAQSSRIATKAAQTALASTDREVSLLRKAIEGQLMDIEEDHTEAYSKTLPSGTIGVGVNMIGGKSLVESQILDHSTFYESVGENNTYVRNTDGSYTVTIVNPFESLTRVLTFLTASNSADKMVSGHKYLFVDTNPNDNVYVGFGSGASAVRNSKANRIIEKQSYGMGLNVDAGFTGTITICPNIYDITSMFGTAADTMTTEEAIAELQEIGIDPVNTYRNFVGQRIISADCEGADSTGFNIWDEVWESGQINNNTGGDQANANCIRSKNYIPVSPNTTYYVKSLTHTARIHYYDSDYGFIYPRAERVNAEFTTPNNAKFVRFFIGGESDAVTTYGNDICINVSQPDTTKNPHNGQYLPYMHDGFSIPQGLRQAHPLRSAGDAYDSLTFTKPSPTAPWKVEHHRKMGIVDLGTLNWIIAESTFHATLPNDAKTYSTASSNTKMMNSVGYEKVTWLSMYNNHVNKTISQDTSRAVRIVDESYSDKSEFKSAMSGQYLIYELAEEVVTDVTSYFPDGFSPLLNAEAGGSLTFKQTGTEFQLPNSTDYFVKTSPSVTTE